MGAEGVYGVNAPLPPAPPQDRSGVTDGERHLRRFGPGPFGPGLRAELRASAGALLCDN